MAATNYLASVPKLMGRENYDDWSFAIENVFVLDGLSKCLEENGETNADTQNKARAKLCLSIDPSIYVHIREAATALDVWITLKKLYGEKSFTRKINLLRTLISLRLDNCDSMENYIGQMIETAQKLTRSGFEITSEWIGSLLLAGLPNRFTPMIMALEHSGI
ncbi:uncharacterized protein [Diabrotica undecimpunctata]|uniref:uncharacterized protein n=1 Tax=Diabrotica undecimpunctata TaxID=50387 RepID=UPI003B6361C7